VTTRSRREEITDSSFLWLDNEPEPKRKTLAQRAGEPRSVAAATPGPRSGIVGTSLAAAGVSLPLS
jgi:hypothetical protein